MERVDQPMKTAVDSETILVVDDAPMVLKVIKKILVQKGYHVLTAESAVEAISILDHKYVDLVITDLKMPKVSGLDLVRHVKENYGDSEVIMITGYPSIESAVEAVKTGAEEYLSKPFTGDELYLAVKRALHKLQLRRTNSARSRDLDFTAWGLLGTSVEMEQVCEAIRKAALDHRPVHITGEHGTGKNLVARTIHYSSIHASRPFIQVDCQQIPEALFEDELSQYFEMASAHGGLQSMPSPGSVAGTLFLDNICTLSPSRQDRLLQVLGRSYLSKHTDEGIQNSPFMLMSASSANVLDLVKKKLFREDLFFQLNFTTITLPPLRKRGDDILLLINHFLRSASQRQGQPEAQFSSDVIRFMKDYQWPGNVSELRSLVEFLTPMGDSPRIDIAALTSRLNLSLQFDEEIDLGRNLSQIEIEYIKKVLKKVRGNKTKAAEILDVDRKTLRKKLLEAGEA